MDSSVSQKDQFWFLRVCRHVSPWLYPYKFHPSLVLMSTTDKITAAVHIVVTMKFTFMYQNTTQLSFYILCSINIHIIAL